MEEQSSPHPSLASPRDASRAMVIRNRFGYRFAGLAPPGSLGYGAGGHRNGALLSGRAESWSLSLDIPGIRPYVGCGRGTK